MMNILLPAIKAVVDTTLPYKASAARPYDPYPLYITNIDPAINPVLRLVTMVTRGGNHGN